VRLDPLIHCSRSHSCAPDHNSHLPPHPAHLDNPESLHDGGISPQRAPAVTAKVAVSRRACSSAEPGCFLLTRIGALVDPELGPPLCDLYSVDLSREVGCVCISGAQGDTHESDEILRHVVQWQVATAFESSCSSYSMLPAVRTCRERRTYGRDRNRCGPWWMLMWMRGCESGESGRSRLLVIESDAKYVTKGGGLFGIWYLAG
jgi:hypothetical protein